jgi:putative ABC transport system permease protein
MFFLPFKEMTFFKMRYLLISFILFFVAILVFVINGLANGLAMDNASSIKTMEADSFYLQENAEERLERSHLKIELENLPKQAQPIGIQMGALSELKSDDKFDVTFMAVQENSFLEPDVVEGRGLREGEKNSVLLNRNLKSKTIKIGSIVQDSRSGTELKVIGFIANQTYSHTPVAIISLTAWETITGGSENSEYNAIIIKKANPILKQEISGLVTNGKWVEKAEVIKGIPGYTAEQNSLYMMLSFLIVIAVFVLAAFFYIMTIQKTAQFGILKAIGAKTSLLVKSTIFQVILLTVVNIAAAVVFTRVFMVVLPADIPFLFDIKQMAMFSAILFLVSIFGSLLSVVNIVKADPIQAMGRIE